MPDIADGEVVFIQGSAKEPYELKNVGGVYSCSCPAWRNVGGPIDRRTCKHLKQQRGIDAEAARLGADPHSMISAPKPKKAKAASQDSDDDNGDDAPPVLLAHKWETDVDLKGWWMSEKLDGVRAWWDGEKFLSRLGNKFWAPSWFTANLPNRTLDGELWVGRQEFQTTVSVVRRQDAGREWEKVKFLIFDAPHLGSGFEERVEWIRGFVAEQQAAHVVAVAHERCQGTAHLKAELARIESLGGEGLMMRRPGSKYEAGRSTSLLKVKTFHDAEGRVVGHEGGKGKHKGRLGALVVQMPDGTRFNVGTGFTDDERREPPPVGSIVTYRYQELSKDGVPRFPSWVGLAIDKAVPTAASGAALPSTADAASLSQTKKIDISATVEATKAPPKPELSSSATLRFVGNEGGVEKFWEITVDGASHSLRFGKVGSAGQERTRTFASAAAAVADADKLVKDKVSKGYRPTSMLEDAR